MTVIVCEKLSIVLRQLFLEELVVIWMGLKKQYVKLVFEKS